MVPFTAHFHGTSGAEFFNSVLSKDMVQFLNATFLPRNSEQKQRHQNDSLFPW